MLILFIGIAIVGLAMVFLGLKWMMKSKTVATFPLMNGLQKFDIPRPGLYAVCIMGGSDVKNNGSFNARITDIDHGKSISLVAPAIKTQLRRNGEPGVEYFQFSVPDAGKYSIKPEHPEHLAVKKSGLKTVRALQSTVPVNSLNVLIKETIPQRKLVFAILLIVLGGNMAMWGSVLVVKPGLIIRDNTVHLMIK